MKRLLILGLLLAIAAECGAARVPDKSFDEFRQWVESTISEKFEGEPRTSAYHFVFAVATSGNNACQMSAAKDIICRSLDGGLLRDGDRVSFLSYELTTWYAHRSEETFTLRDGVRESKFVRVEPMPESSWTEIERERARIGGTGGHDIDAALYAALKYLKDEGSADKAVIIIFQGNNMTRESPTLSPDTKSPLASRSPFRTFFPGKYSELLSIAREFNFPVSESGIDWGDYLPLEIPEKNLRDGKFLLPVWCFASAKLQPVGSLPQLGTRKDTGCLRLSVVDAESRKPIPGAQAHVNGSEQIILPGQPAILKLGEHKLDVTAPGHEREYPVLVSLKHYSATDIEVMLQPAHFNWAFLLLSVPVLGFFRWRVRIDGESRVIDLPLVWPFPWHICSSVEGDSRSNELVLSQQNASDLQPGRLLSVASFFVPTIRRDIRGARSMPVIGSNFVEIPTANEESRRLTFKASLAVGLRIGIQRGYADGSGPGEDEMATGREDDF